MKNYVYKQRTSLLNYFTYVLSLTLYFTQSIQYLFYKKKMLIDDMSGNHHFLRSKIYKKCIQDLAFLLMGKICTHFPLFYTFCFLHSPNRFIKFNFFCYVDCFDHYY